MFPLLASNVSLVLRSIGQGQRVHLVIQPHSARGLARSTYRIEGYRSLRLGIGL